ncbi:DUF4032 domain-containing protein [Brevibacterium luteolum]|nr:DUF4032 domain-containing protein [Brevibacterium luteolum]
MKIHADQFTELVEALPWDVPLARWKPELLIGLPRGISRHVVRFVEFEGTILAVKETQDAIAVREYELLTALADLDAPAVRPLGYVTGRTDADGQPLPGALLTPHLSYSLPFRDLCGKSVPPQMADLLVDALAVLIVRLHLVGFFWGDVSLSNTLFRRDADALAAYLVDAETGELHDSLSAGQRSHDLDLARTNIAGEFLDLQAGGLADPDVDPMAMSNRLSERYDELWAELTAAEAFNMYERWRIDQRIERLNELGFDLGELTVTTDLDGVTTRIEPKVVAPGHFQRRLRRLTGIDAEKQQARRMLNDLDVYRAAKGLDDEAEVIVAERWLADVYRPVLEAITDEYSGRLEPPQVFHEFLDHRAEMSETAGRDVSTPEAVAAYRDEKLAHYPREAHLFRDPDTAVLRRLAEAESAQADPELAESAQTGPEPADPEPAESGQVPPETPEPPAAADETREGPR